MSAGTHQFKICRLIPRSVSLLVGVVLVALALAPAAAAHARLLATSPQNGAILTRSPGSVRISFDDVITPGSTTAVVRDGGKSARGGSPYAGGKGNRTLVIPLGPRLARGDYSVRWSIVTDDGHPLSGVLAFSVGTGQPPRLAVLHAGRNSPSAAELVARWLFFAGLLGGAGAAIFRKLVWRPSLATAALDDEQREQLERRSRRATAVLLAVACYLVTLGAAVAIAVTPGSSLTRFGRWMEIGMALAATAVAIALVAAVLTRASRLLTLVSIGVPAMLLIPSIGGHAFDPRELRPLTFAMDLLHVAAAAVWIGGLLQLLLLIPRVAAPLARESRTALYADLFRRFSRVAFISVPVLVLTGVIRSLFEISDVSQVWSTSYGQTLLVKVGLLGVLGAIGWVNRYRLVPRIATPARPDAGTLSTLRRLRVSVGSEVVLLMVVIGAVALLTGLKPARLSDNGPATAGTSHVHAQQPAGEK